MKKILIGIVFILTALQLLAVPQVLLPASNADLLDLLDHELSRRDIYTAIRFQKIDSLKTLIATDSAKAYRFYLDLGALESGLNSDSAIISYNRGIEATRAAGDSLLIQRYMICRVAELRRVGAIPDAMHDIDMISRAGLYPENRTLYYTVGRDLYMTMAEIYEESELHATYMKSGLEFAKKHISYLPTDSAGYKLSRALVYFAENNDPLGLATLHEFESEIDMESPEFMMAMTILGGRYLIKGNYDMAIRYLGMAALAEVYSSDRQGTALIRLGMALYGQKDIIRAHNYLSVALDDALKASAKINCVMISGAFMPVAQELRHRDDRKFMMLSSLVVSLVVAMVLLGQLYRTKRRKVSEMAKVRQMLATANLSKETYISEFMNLCSSYIESLEDFNRMCRRKITAGQFDDLMQLIKSGKVIDDQRKKFDDIFDDSFLAIYPTFIEEVNMLLIPEKKIATPASNVLTTELRVLAFTSLGVEDSAQIARFLGVSLNTIYTYRNKLRNKAISRDTFDTDIMKIGVIE